jgi:hypothetical protein
MRELAVHPVAALFPMLADDELDELAADIKERGLLLGGTGSIVGGEGRNERRRFLLSCYLGGSHDSRH